MAMIARFEDIQAWRAARKLVKRIDKLSNAGMIAKDFGLHDQIQRIAVSSMTNIADGLIVSQKRNLHGSWILHADQPWKFKLCYRVRHSICN